MLCRELAAVAQVDQPVPARPGEPELLRRELRWWRRVERRRAGGVQLRQARVVPGYGAVPRHQRKAELLAGLDQGTVCLALAADGRGGHITNGTRGTERAEAVRGQDLDAVR